MPTLEMQISLRLNGSEMSSLGFPWRRRIEVDEIQPFDTTEADDGNDTTFSDIPAAQVASIQALVIQAVDQALGVRMYASSGGNVALRLNQGGFIIAFDCVGITNTDADVNNNSGSDAQIRGIAGGT